MTNFWCIFNKKKYIKRITQIDKFFNFFEFNKVFFIDYLSADQLSLRNRLNSIIKYNRDIEDLYMYLNLIENEHEKTLLEEIKNTILTTRNGLIDLENETFFLEETDILNTYFDIQAGSGGTDAQDWTNILLKMYTSWFVKKNFKYEILNISYGEIIGIKSVSIKVNGKYAYGWLKYENGIHRLVRKSPFDSNKKRHTSFASVFVYPENEKNSHIEINDNDIKIDTFRSSGAGGQHVNKTDSAVRITHLKTGIITQCQSERSQHKNKITALKQLKQKLIAFYNLNKNVNEKKIEENKLSITWGNQIRSYVFDKSYIKDLRTQQEYNDINFILDGNLDQFILSILKM